MAVARCVRQTFGRIAAILAVVILSVSFALFVAGPASNLYPVAPLQPLAVRFPGGKASVRNPELADELAILESSGIFEVVPASQARKVITLHPREDLPVCGTPLLFTWFTFGFASTTIPIESTFSFTLVENGVASKHQFVLQGERRVSRLERLYSPFRSDVRTWGRILASEYAAFQVQGGVR